MWDTNSGTRTTDSEEVTAEFGIETEDDTEECERSRPEAERA